MFLAALYRLSLSDYEQALSSGFPILLHGALMAKRQVNPIKQLDLSKQGLPFKISAYIMEKSSWKN